MNSMVTHLAEKIIEIGYSIRTYHAPNPFRPVIETDPWWQNASLDTFYAIPETPLSFSFTKLAEAKGEKLLRFQFPSAYISPHTHNNTVFGLADLRPKGETKASLIFLHGHMMTRATLFPMIWYSRKVVTEGYDIYYMSLPYHMKRTPPKSYSGQHSLNSDIAGTALTFMQGVRDVRSLVRWISQEKNSPVAIAGISLGAYTACMTAVVEPHLRAVISLLGGASLARIPWDGYQGGKIRRQLQEGGITLEQLERYWSLISPGNFKPAISSDRVLMIGGQYDEIVTPNNVEALWNAWDRPKICWYPCGHITSTVYHQSISTEISTFLAQCVGYT